MRTDKKRKLLAKATRLKARIDAVKPLYQELDDIIDELLKANFRGVVTKTHLFRIVDNFALKNVCFRPAAIRRFELRITRRGK